MPKKYAHLVHQDDVVYLPGNGPSGFQPNAHFDQERAQAAARIRASGAKPVIIAGTDHPGPQAHASIYAIVPHRGTEW